MSKLVQKPNPELGQPPDSVEERSTDLLVRDRTEGEWSADPRLRLTPWLWRPAWHVLDVLRPDTMQVGVGTQWGRSRVVFSLSARPWVRVDSPEDQQHAHDHRVPLAPAPVRAGERSTDPASAAAGRTPSGGGQNHIYRARKLE